MSGFSEDCQMSAGNCEFSEKQNMIDVTDLRFVSFNILFNLKNRLFVRTTPKML